ncbi:hypothetical protein SAMN05518672_11575 [Chitinophaga sp. CF118]|uniref:hypothetical protein n=1 Tax=Chitinophaga sp. CF118 TaxID=1884367 RepID=UPI0008F03037|nr:hypothetical protein [Chitinophaga sp. CF118]SFF07387.1 hypothetical protein SAMN05518672_11575 [Chitinophaga sp. CF118]
MKKVLSLSILFVILFTVFYSCRKSDVQSIRKDKTTQSGLSVEEGKAYFNQLDTSAVAARQGKAAVKMWPQWANPYSNANGKGQQYIEVPVITERKRTILFLDKEHPAGDEDKKKQKQSAFQTLIVFKDRNSQVYYRIVSYVGSPAYLKRHSYNIGHNRIGNLDSDFDGYLNYSNQKGEHLFSIKVENGRAVKRIGSKAASQQRNTVARASGGYEVCETWCNEITEQFCGQTTVTVCSPATGQCWEQEGPEECWYETITVDCYEECYWVEEEEPNPPCYDQTSPSGYCDNLPGDGGGEGNEATFGVDCSSYSFTHTSLANWQEAGLNKIRLKWVWVGPGRDQSYPREMWIDHVVYGLPQHYANGQVITPGQAANIAAAITDQAKILTYQRFREEPFEAESNVITYFKQQLQILMVTQGGTAGTTGTGSPGIVFRNEQRAFFGTRDCN